MSAEYTGSATGRRGAAQDGTMAQVDAGGRRQDDEGPAYAVALTSAWRVMIALTYEWWEFIHKTRLSQRFFKEL